MSLFGNYPRYTWGVIRNAQLVPIYLSDWTLRVYVADDNAPPELAVPPRILNKLRQLGVEIEQVSSIGTVAPRNWRLLAADDQQLDYFLVRDADGRITQREADAIKDWLSTTRNNTVHCIRDHPEHSNQAIVDGLWGGRPRELRYLLRKRTTEFLGLSETSSLSRNKTNSVLNDVLWPTVADSAYCHDSVSPCSRWTPTARRHPFPTSRLGKEYLGQKYDQHHNVISKQRLQLKADVMCL